MVTKKTGKEVVSWEEELAKDAKAYAEKEKSGGGAFIGTKGGEFSFKGDVIGTDLRVIALDYVFDNANYEEDYDPDNPTAPDCFAIGYEEDELVPSDDVEDPQASDCAGCWANKFKSDRRGKGKACKNNRKVAVVAADNFDDITEAADVAFLRLPPTSLKYWGGFVKKVGNVLGLPPYAVAVTLRIEKEGTYFVIKPDLETLEKVPAEIGQAIMSLRKQCHDELLQGYAKFDDDEQEVAAPAKRPAKKAAPKKKVAKKKAAPKKKAPVRRGNKF